MKVKSGLIIDWDSFAMEAFHYSLLQEFKRIDLEKVSLHTKLDIIQMRASKDSITRIWDEFCCIILQNIVHEPFDSKLLASVFSKMCKNKYAKSVEFLLGYVEPRNYDLQRATSDNNIEIVTILLRDSRIDAGDLNNLALRAASELGNADIVEILLQDKNVEPADVDNAAIRVACIYGNFKVARMLLQDPRVDPSSCDNEAIRKTSNIEILEMLLKDSRADPSARNNEALVNASRYGRADIVQLLLQDSQVDPTMNNYEALVVSLQAGDSATTQLLLGDKRVDQQIFNKAKEEYYRIHKDR
ncbi:hypothetical protein HDV01_006084 [Terramyces sp. JEL0728]|nr:hypothetical protein HDV01_006084 [Terramyces sp. JEL0728]